MQPSKKIPATYMRGGTSKGLLLNLSSLPPLPQSSLEELLLSIMGSPDPTGLQIDGMGGGLTSTSKIALISKRVLSGLPYLVYNFGQVAVREPKIDWSTNCGNLASALFQFASNHSEYEDCFEKLKEVGKYTHKLRVWQENKSHEMAIWGSFSQEGASVKISGVQKKYPPVFVEFKDIGGGNNGLFPTGKVRELLDCDGEMVEVTLLSGANSWVFVDPKVFGLKGTEMPNEIDFKLIKPKYDRISQKAAALMKVELNDAFKLAWVAPAADYVNTSGDVVHSSDFDVTARVISSGRVHHAFPGTGAINVALACSIEGTLPNLCLSQDEEKMRKSRENKQVAIGHPGGVMDCEIDVVFDEGKKEWRVLSAGFIRTARVIMEGIVYAE